jgi:hypothetical protein
MIAGTVDLARRMRCAWHRYKAPIQPRRVTMRYCNSSCRRAAHRAQRYAVRLRQCTVEKLSRRQARAFILKYELLGSTSKCAQYFGLRDPLGRLLSVVGFGAGPYHAAQPDAVVLERGATMPRAPNNAASYLISRALRIGRRVHGWKSVLL